VTAPVPSGQMRTGTIVYAIDWPRVRRMASRQAQAQIRIAVAETRLVARRNVLYRRYPGFPNPRPIGLANSIFGNVRPTTDGWRGVVGSYKSYAMSVESGASPHIIRPRAASYGGGLYGRGGYLRFFWVKRGRWVRMKMVNHPGQKGKHYLRNALISVGRRRGFRVIIT
jgi:hypothetical protein